MTAAGKHSQARLRPRLSHNPRHERSRALVLVVQWIRPSGLASDHRRGSGWGGSGCGWPLCSLLCSCPAKRPPAPPPLPRAKNPVAPCPGPQAPPHVGTSDPSRTRRKLWRLFRELVNSGLRVWCPCRTGCKRTKPTVNSGTTNGAAPRWRRGIITGPPWYAGTT